MIAGICVGHSRRGDEGAVSVGQVSEWRYNRIVAENLVLDLERRGIRAVLIDDYRSRYYRPAVKNCARLLDEYGATVAVELHFNAAARTAAGYEYLYWKYSERGRRMAEIFLEEQRRTFPAEKCRGSKPRGPGDRGAGWLRGVSQPAVIAEPFFGTNWDEWHLWAQNHDMLASMYARALESIREM